MGKHKKQKRDKNEEVKLVIRIEAGLRDAFIAACQEMDTTASREIRRFIRNFLARPDDSPKNATSYEDD